MTLFKKLLGYPLLGLGGLFLLAMVVAPLAEISNAEKAAEQAGNVTPDKVAANHRTTITGGLMVGVPLSLAGSALVMSAHEQAHQLSHRQTALSIQEARLRKVLYRLIESTDGQVTLVQFAIAADIPAEEARTYIDTQAKAFSADFDVTESGSIVYQFPIS